MKAASILVTGASGFIGNHAIPYLEKTYSVTSISLRNLTIPDQLFMNVDCVLCLSGLAHQSSQIDESLYFTINKDLPLTLAKNAKEAGVKHFIYLSSVKVFGNMNGMEFDENSACSPTDAYGKSKLEAEKELLKLNSPEFIMSIIRPAVVYGAGVKGNIKKLIRLTEKLPILPFGNIQVKRSLVYIDNLLALLAKIIEMQPAGIFIASDQPVTVSELIAEINQNLARPKKLIFFPGFLRHIIKVMMPSIYNRLFEELVVSSKLTKDRLVYSPPVSFQEGMAITVHAEFIGHAD